ncbi:MAG: hypothetical protein RBU45_06600 [Myxococcota bacterium]|jgi:hypothetical protein|nr:hypothetical protein [Myxococcota bacterium]
MKEKADLERYLLELGQPYEEIADGIYMVNDEVDNVDNIIIMWAPPLVVFRVKLLDLGTGDHSQLLRRLLELNATEMVAGAYGLEGEAVVVVDSLQSENLDYNEFRASIDSLVMAITVHYPMLKRAMAVQ